MIASKVNKMQLHGLLFKLGIIRKTSRKVLFKMDKLKEILHLLDSRRTYPATFVGDFDRVEKTNQRSWYIDIIPSSCKNLPNISLADTDVAVLNDLKFEYLRKIGDDVDRRRRELQEQERQEMVSKKNERRREREEQQQDQQPQPETDKEVEDDKKSINVPKNCSLVRCYYIVRSNNVHSKRVT